MLDTRRSLRDGLRLTLAGAGLAFALSVASGARADPAIAGTGPFAPSSARSTPHAQAIGSRSPPASTSRTRARCATGAPMHRSAWSARPAP